MGGGRLGCLSPTWLMPSMNININLNNNNNLNNNKHINGGGVYPSLFLSGIGLLSGVWSSQAVRAKGYIIIFFFLT